MTLSNTVIKEGQGENAKTVAKLQEHIATVGRIDGVHGKSYDPKMNGVALVVGEWEVPAPRAIELLKRGDIRSEVLLAELVRGDNESRKSPMSAGEMIAERVKSFPYINGDCSGDMVETRTRAPATGTAVEIKYAIDGISGGDMVNEKAPSARSSVTAEQEFSY